MNTTIHPQIPAVAVDRFDTLNAVHEAERRDEIFAALRAFVRQRPGLDPANYAGDMKMYRAESYAITQDASDALRLLRQVELRPATFTADVIVALMPDRRLELAPAANGVLRVEYTTGQCFQTEYRKAVAHLCADLLWAARRDDIGERDVFGVAPYRAAGAMHKHFMREFGRRIANRYFN